MPLRILVNIAKPLASANTSGGIFRKTLNCLPFGALKVEVDAIAVPFGVVVPDAGSVTVVGIPSTTDKRLSFMVLKFRMLLTGKSTQNPCSLLHLFREVPRHGPEPLATQLHTQQLRKRQIFQFAASQAHFSSIIIHPASNRIRPLPRLFIRFPSPDFPLVLHRILPCLFADIFTRNRGRGGGRRLCSGDSAGVARRGNGRFTHLGKWKRYRGADSGTLVDSTEMTAM